jgi:hypothetical protein
MFASPVHGHTLHARPRFLPLLHRPPTGTQALASADIHVPSTYDPKHPAPLVIVLGATTAALRRISESYGAIVVAPCPDTPSVDRALAAVFDAYAIDHDHIAVAGIASDAPFALALAIANDDLIRAILTLDHSFDRAFANWLAM